MTSPYQYGDTLKCFDSMDGYLWGHRASGASRERITWIIRGMSFAMKYLPAIRTIGAGKGQSAGETRNRNRRRKSMSGLSLMDYRMIMILQLYRITAAGCLPGACCGGKGCRRVSCG